MVDIPETPFFGPVTRIEPTNIALGGDVVNTPNLQLKQLADRDKYLFNLVAGAPVVSAPIQTQVALELGDQIDIDLNAVFSGNFTPFTYSVTVNSDPAKVTTNINAGTLELNFPEWTTNTNQDVVSVSLTVRATDTNNATADNQFVVQVSNLSTLFTVPYYEFVYIDSGSVNSGANIFVDASERDNIIADPGLSAVFTPGAGGAPVFNAVLPSNPTLPTGAIYPGNPSGPIEGVYRFRYTGTPPADGSYLYTGEDEAVTVRGNPDFVEESGGAGNPAFYAFRASLARENSFKRYRWLTRRVDGDYIYALGASNPNLPPADFSFEGVVAKIHLID